MRIDVVMLIGGLSEVDLKRRLEILRSYASMGTEVRLVMTKNPPPSVDSLAEMELAAPGILEQVLKSERDGADAVLIWGGHDPSLLSSRSLVDIPVIGPGSASMHIAAFLADYFSLIVQLPEVEQLAWRQIRDYRLEEKCIGVYSVDIPVLELGKPESYDAVKETVTESIEDGADAVCFGCRNEPFTLGSSLLMYSVISLAGVMGYPAKSRHPARSAPSAQAMLPSASRFPGLNNG